MTEGVIKFNCEWVKSEPPNLEQITKLNDWRNKLYAKNLIGVDSEGIGYGNISTRTDGNQFIISGSGTGGIEDITKEHYTTVTKFDIETNTLKCEGPIKASSESLTHAAVYLADPNVNAVIHVHNNELWKRHLNKLPTTSCDAAYGTPQMAHEIFRLLTQTEISSHMVIMGGHEQGIIYYGKDLDDAGYGLFTFL